MNRSAHITKALLFLLSPILSFWVWCCNTSPALADESPSVKDKNASQVYLDAGHVFWQGELFEEACAMYKIAIDHDSTAKGAIIAWARCQGQLGKLSVSYETFNRALDLARKTNDTERIARIGEYLKRLEKLQTYIEISVPFGEKFGKLEILLDDHVVAPSQWNTKIAVDFGKHRIFAHAPNKQNYTNEVDVSEASKVYPVAIEMRDSEAITVLHRTLCDGIGTQIDRLSKTLNQKISDTKRNRDLARKECFSRALHGSSAATGVAFKGLDEIETDRVELCKQALREDGTENSNDGSVEKALIAIDKQVTSFDEVLHGCEAIPSSNCGPDRCLAVTGETETLWPWPILAFFIGRRIFSPRRRHSAAGCRRDRARTKCGTNYLSHSRRPTRRRR